MESNRSTYISTGATTVVKGSSGYLRKIVLTETAAGAITIYNHGSAASGEVIGVIKASCVEQTFDFGKRFMDKGIVIVTAAASKLTVIFD